jgi:ketosteroid isomerase-like protein
VRAVAASGVGERGGGERAGAQVRHLFRRVAAGDKAVLHMLVRLTSRRTGESFDIPVVEIFAFRDGKITDDDVYHEDASLVASAA